MRGVLPLLWLSICASACASSGARPSRFVGGVAGVSTLSADASSVVNGAGADVSLYKPENGPALNLFAGVHLSDYFSVQGNYVLNRNTLTLSSIRSSDAFFEERRQSTQHAFVVDGLLYFRNRDSWARPYLSTGIGIVHFATRDPVILASRGQLVRPSPDFDATHPALRVAVGIDLRTVGPWRFRYSFSETISKNPVSTRLSPPGERGLANFQNLFGAILTF